MEYGEKELGFKKTHIYELTDAAEIGLQIGFSDKSEKQPKERHLYPLKQVPEEVRKAIWEEATRKGWKALGYESFKDYGEKELGYKETHIYQLVDAAEISLQLGYSSDSAIAESQPKEWKVLNCTHVRTESIRDSWRNLASLGPIGPIPQTESQARPLTRLD